MATLQCANGHALYMWKKLKTWKVLSREVECDLCNKTLAPTDPRLKCDQKCDYDVCYKCAKERNATAMPPCAAHEAISTMDSAEYRDGSAAHDSKPDQTRGALFAQHAALLEAAGATYVADVPPLGPEDAIFIVDMQNDFVPSSAPGHPEPDGGGRFGVTEGHEAADKIVELIRKAVAAGSRIIATRDYHPHGHCSFEGTGGIFPPHCIQGHLGSFFFPPIAAALKEAKSSGAEVQIVFKGFAPFCDSFGGFTYPDEYYAERHLGGEPREEMCGACKVDWTGCFALKTSGDLMGGDVNAPPDVMAVYDRRPMKDTVAGVNRLFACGLAMDFCVLDSTINARAAGVAPGGVFLVADAARAAFIPQVGTFGTGFLSDPAEVVRKVKTAGVQLIQSEKILG